jgi:predicted TIM-barrel fold metal-dependent hydrolase
MKPIENSNQPIVIDSHLHLDDRSGGSAAQAVERLLDEMKRARVSHACVLHLLTQPWDIDTVASALAGRPTLTGFANVDPMSATAHADLQRAGELGFRGLKLHPRLQKYRPSDSKCVSLVRLAGELQMPVIIDCFPDGDWLLAGLSVLDYACLAKQSPDTIIVVAHAAGHHCLDLMMLLKRVPNLWLDLSYSLLYYGGPVVDALFYCMRSLRYERALFGTDYPDRPLDVSVRTSLELFERFGVNQEAREKVLWKNARHLLQKPSDWMPTTGCD